MHHVLTHDRAFVAQNDRITIGGQTMNSTFYTWYTEGGEARGATAVDGDWPTDSTCKVAGHGSC